MIARVPSNRNGSGDYSTLVGTSLVATSGLDGNVLLIDLDAAFNPWPERFVSPLNLLVTSRLSSNGEQLFVHNPLEFALVDSDTGQVTRHEVAQPGSYPSIWGFAVTSPGGAYLAGFDGSAFKGLVDGRHCTLIAPFVVFPGTAPSEAFTNTEGACVWFSDYYGLTSGETVWAESVRLTVTPSGNVSVTTTYPAEPLDC